MSSPVRQFKKGDLVEGYRVLDDLGQGAASWIYLVQDPKSKHVWALKHVHKGDAKDTRFLDQAAYEHQVSSKLNHPGLRRIEKCIRKKQHFINLTDVFLIMELVDGVSVDRKPPKSFAEAIEIFLQVGRALQHMHERGFVHADMKPNNIMVSHGQDDDRPVAKIIDLGQSCPAGTVKARIQGTPDYIAPEQVHRRPITHKTDIYNLGATMYWTLTRRHIPTALPKGDSLLSRIDDELMEKAVPAAELNPRIPAKLNQLIMHCIEIEPAKRPDDMAGVCNQLELILGMIRAKAAQARAAAGSSPSAGSGSDSILLNSGSSALGLKVGEPSAQRVQGEAAEGYAGA